MSSHNSKYYVKKLKTQPVNNKTVDFFFKQAALQASKSSAASKQTVPVGTVQPNTSGVTDHTVVSPSSSEDEIEEKNMVPDQRLFCLPKYEAKYKWLYYSAAKEGYACKLCELFASTDTSNVFITGTTLGTHPSRKLDGHQSGKCHKFCESKYISINSSNVPQKVKRTVADMLKTSVDTKKQQEIHRNRLYVQNLVKILYFIAHQRWSINSFETLVDFVIDIGSPDVTAYIEAQPENSVMKYTSGTVATDLLASISYVLEKPLLEKLRTAPYYALLADESSDEAHREQFAILVRFPFNKSVTDHYLGVIHVNRTDAASLMAAIEIFLIGKGVDIKKALFVGFDGCNTMSGENKGLQRRFRHHVPHQLYINCRNHKLALCIKHLMASFPVLEDVDSLLLSIWKLFHYSPQKYAIFMEVQSAYGLKNLKIIRAAATRWLSHGHACVRLIDRYVQVIDALDEMVDRKHDPEIDGIRNLLCAKNTVAGILVLCDLLEPVIVFSNYLQAAHINFSRVNVKLQELIATLHLLIERFRSSLQIPDRSLYFSRLGSIFEQIDERTDLRRRLREQGAYKAEQIIEEIAVPITHRLIHELEDRLHCSPVLAAFSVFNLDSVPDSLPELDDYGNQSIQTLARHYGNPVEDVFQRHTTVANPTYTEAFIVQEFDKFRRQMFMLNSILFSVSHILRPGTLLSSFKIGKGLHDQICLKSCTPMRSCARVTQLCTIWLV